MIEAVGDSSMRETGHQAQRERSLLRVFSSDRAAAVLEYLALMLLIFAYAGDPAPMVNEAHYLVKAKSYWDPSWCSNDLFVTSSKAHTTFYFLFGWPTQFVSLSATAWLGRLVAWSMLAVGLQQLCRSIFQSVAGAGRVGISLAVAAVWIAAVEYGNLAGEWVVGGLEAKVPAYGLILLALADMNRRRWNRVWLWLGAASAFHVLSGGWAVIAGMCAWWLTERKRDDRVRLVSGWLVAGGVISLLGLLPALALTLGTSAEDSTAAARIYSYYRIRHHLLPADFNLSWYLRHGALLAFTTLLGFQLVPKNPALRALAGFTIGAVSIAAVGMIVGFLPAVAPDLAAKLLRYYWFRLSDAVVPLMCAVLVATLLLHECRRWKIVGLVTCGLAFMLVGYSSVRRIQVGVPPSVSNDLLGRDVGAPADVQRQVMHDWLAVCRWVRLSSSPDAIFLTPRHQQTFKWYAERAEVVNWKDVPQDASSLQEWHQRFMRIYPQRLGHVRVTIRYDSLREFRRDYGVEMMIVDQRVTGERLPLVKLYPRDGETNANYAVYELPSD